MKSNYIKDVTQSLLERSNNEPLIEIGRITPDNTLSFMTTDLSKMYNWKPQSDITAYELALLTPLLLSIISGSIASTTMINNLPENIKRHLEEV